MKLNQLHMDIKDRNLKNISYEYLLYIWKKIDQRNSKIIKFCQLKI